MEPILLAKVAISTATYAIDKPYNYAVPLEMRGTLHPGTRVLVPFGAGNKRVEGLVLDLAEGERLPRLKSVLAPLDSEPVLSEELLKLALWMRNRWFCTVYDAARAMLPAGLYFAIRDTYRVAQGVEKETA